MVKILEVANETRIGNRRIRPIERNWIGGMDAQAISHRYAGKIFSNSSHSNFAGSV